MKKIHEKQNRYVDLNSNNITFSNDPDAPSTRASTRRSDLDEATLDLGGTSSRKPTHLNISIHTKDAKGKYLKEHDQVVVDGGSPHGSDGAFSESEQDDESRHLLLPVEQEDYILLSGEGNEVEDTPIDVAAGEHGFRWRYDDYTTIDWIHDSIRDQVRLRGIRKMGGLASYWDASQAWVVLTLVGLQCGIMASLMDLIIPVLESVRLASAPSTTTIPGHKENEITIYGFLLYIAVGLGYALAAFTIVSLGPSHSTAKFTHASSPKSYDASGSGIPQVKVILGGFVIRGFLGFKTLFLKFTSLLLTMSSGLLVGIQGPLVHLSCAIGNVTTRIFKKYKGNDAKRREIMSAACAAGVSVAFGAPIGGVLFSLEEVSYYFPPKTMWRSFFCALVAAVSIKIINPFGTGKLVMFQVTYDEDWHALEMIAFVFIGIVGGLYGALFIKTTMWMSKSGVMKKLLGSPLTQLIFTSLLTSIFSYPFVLSRMSNTLFVAELLQECKEGPEGLSLFNTQPRNTSSNPYFPLFSYFTAPPEPQSILCKQPPLTIIMQLSLILLLKSILMILTFGNRVPGGLFMPSMVVGCCFGRLVGTLVEYYLPLLTPNAHLISIIPGVYAMVGAAATLSGVTRMTVSLSVIMFELTGGLQYILPIMAGIMTSKWVADSLTHRDSIYDRIIQENGFPYLNLKHSLALEKSGKVEDKEIMTPLSSLITLDMDLCYTVQEIQVKLDLIQERVDDSAGHDGGFPLVKAGDILVGFISYTDLQHALYLVHEQHGEIVGFQNLAHTYSSTSTSSNNPVQHHHYHPNPRLSSPSTISTPYFQIHHPIITVPQQSSAQPRHPPETTPPSPIFDLSQWVDKAPLQVSNLSCCELVVELFSKLGVRSVIVVRAGGVMVGLVHKKKVLEFLGRKSRRGR